MFDMWKEEPSEAEIDAVITKAADAILKRKLEAPAVFALEMHKPIAPFAAYGSLALAPFLVPFFGFDAVNDYSRVFSKRENVERLLLKLEAGGKGAALAETS